MKKLQIFTLVLSAVALLSTCKKEDSPTVLTLSITQHPADGIEVGTLTTAFTGTLSDAAKSTVVTAEWWWEDGNHSNQSLKSSTTYTFDAKGVSSKTTSYSAPSGCILLNYYWVKLSWTDGKGQHSLESSKACCADSPTVLTLLVTQHPTGGSQVGTVSAAFTGTLSGAANPTVVTAEWWWESFIHTSQTLKSSTTYTFDTKGVSSKTTSYSAPYGYIFLNYYWVKLSWTDDKGQHTLESSKAYCTD